MTDVTEVKYASVHSLQLFGHMPVYNMNLAFLYFQVAIGGGGEKITAHALTNYKKN